jgi:tRNA modification GTPase
MMATTRPGNDTIAAVATGSGGGIGIVRISGPAALAIAERLFQGRGGRSLGESAPFSLILGVVHEPDTREPLDEVLAVRMPEGRSYTGEATVEIQGHGGRGVLEAILRAALTAGARHAEPGEFTKRAFLNGRLDLTQAEAVAELIGAESDASRRGALALLRGALAAEINRMRERLLDYVASVEAAIDFEEGEIAADLPAPERYEALARDIRLLAAQASGSAGMPGGVRIALAGRANSGKSSIFNYLLNSERSIVSALPGTTRDYIEERSVICGASVTLIDTAGVRDAESAVEAEGVRRSLRLVQEAAIPVLVLDGSEPNHPEDARLLDLVAGRAPIIVISKRDLPARFDWAAFPGSMLGLEVHALSTVNREGFPDFIAALDHRCRKAAAEQGPATAAPNSRHRAALEQAAARLGAAAEHARSGAGFLDQAALELLGALTALGEITGQTVSEDVLERIFSRFCVGK